MIAAHKHASRCFQQRNASYNIEARVANCSHVQVLVKATLGIPDLAQETADIVRGHWTLTGREPRPACDVMLHAPACSGDRAWFAQVGCGFGFGLVGLNACYPR